MNPKHCFIRPTLSSVCNAPLIRAKVYGLYDETLLLKYIGYTRDTLEHRLKGHINEAFRCTNPRHHRCNGIKAMYRRGLLPTIDIITEVKNGPGAEILYIKYYRDLGYDLWNMTDGGDGCNAFKGCKHKETTKAEMSLIRKNKMKKYGFLNTLETRKILSEIGKRRRWTKETHTKMDGKPRSEKIRKKISKSHFGIMHTEKTKQILREKAIEQFKDPEMRYRCGRKKGYITPAYVKVIRSENANQAPRLNGRFICKE